MSYYMSKVFKAQFEQAVDRVTEELKKEGFGVLTDIDVQATLKKKLDVDFRKYRILGACNPPFAHKALQIEERVGLMLPCNVIVQEKSGGDVEAAAIDPVVAMEKSDNEHLRGIAVEVKERLKRVLAAL